MSTRCTLTIEGSNRGEDSAIQVYRHWDGYPDAVIPDLNKVLAYAWPLPRFELDDFAAALIAAWKQPGGGNIYVDPRSDLSHDNIDYAYTITHDGKSKHVDVACWDFSASAETTYKIKSK